MVCCSCSWEARTIGDGKKVLRCAPLHYLALLHHHDDVRFLDGGQAVRDHDGGATHGHTVKRRLHEPLAVRIQGAGGLIQKENLRAHKNTRKRGPLGCVQRTDNAIQQGRFAFNGESTQGLGAFTWPRLLVVIALFTLIHQKHAETQPNPEGVVWHVSCYHGLLADELASEPQSKPDGLQQDPHCVAWNSGPPTFGFLRMARAMQMRCF